MFSTSLGNIPVRIHFSFFLMALLLGASGATDLRFTAIWIVVVFVSVMIHELGHALTGRMFGLRPEIDLHGMGGTTSWGGERMRVSAPKRIAISLAGPMVGIVLGGALLVLAGMGLLRLTAAAASIVDMIIFVNLGWGIFNLVPILPLDGGNVMAQVLALLTGGGGRKAAHIISLVLASLGAAYGLLTQRYWIAFLAAMFAMQNFRAIRPAAPGPPDAGSAGGIPRW